MEHNMNLVPWAFEEVKSGRKDIEVRLNDEKRQKMNVGDIIVFTNTETGEQLKAQIIERHLFNTFEELFNSFDHTRIGVNETDTADIMNNFYSKEDQEKYKALGIEIKLI
jgi:ASC-1-like (ASCH) protein